MIIIAHRGASLDAPENTIKAFESAYQQGARVIECDIALSKDNVPLIIHDDSLERTTNGNGFVRDFFWSELSGLDAGFGCKIPRLDEVIAWSKCRNLKVNYEIKAVSSDCVGITIDSILSCFDDFGLAIFSSFQLELLEQLRIKQPQVVLHALSMECSDDLIYKAQRIACQQINLSISSCSPYWIDKIHSMGMKVGVFTVNHSPLRDKLGEWRVDAIFTDNMQLLAQANN